MYGQQNQFEKALECFEKAERLDSTNVHAHCKRGVALQALGKHTDALKIFEKLGEPTECQPFVLYLKAKSEAALGENGLALDLVNLAIERDPKLASFWALKGHTLIQLDRNMEALGCLEKALEINPNMMSALNDKGIALASMGLDYKKKALECFEKVISMNPKSRAAWTNKGIILQELDLEEEAIKSFTTAIDLGSKNPCVYCLMGISKNRLGDNIGALVDFNKAFELGLKKECATFHQCRAIVLNTLKRHEDALREINEAIRIEPKNIDLLGTKISILRKLGKTDEARQTAEKLVGLQPTNPNAMNSTAYALYELGYFTKGLDLVKKALENQPDNVYFLDTLACLLSGLGRDMESLEAFSKALLLKKHDKQITWKELVKVYDRLGKNDEAKKIRLEHAEDM